MHASFAGDPAPRRRRGKAANLRVRGRRLSLFALLVAGCQRGATAEDAAPAAASTEAHADGNVPSPTGDSGGWRVPSPVAYSNESDPRHQTRFDVPTSMSLAPVPASENPARSEWRVWEWPRVGTLAATSARNASQFASEDSIPPRAQSREEGDEGVHSYVLDGRRYWRKTLRTPTRFVSLSLEYNEAMDAEVRPIARHILLSFRRSK